MIRFKRFFELGPDLLVLTDLDGKIRRANPVWSRVMGYEPATLVDRDLFQFIAAKDRTVIAKAFREFRTTDQPFEFATGITTAAGDERRVQLHAVAEDSRVYWAIHDVTTEERDRLELRRAHAETKNAHRAAVDAHREIEEWFRLLVENTNYVAYIQDRELRYTWIVNPGAPFEAEDLIGRTDSEIFSAHAASELNRQKAAVLRTGKPRTVEISVIVDTEERFFESSIFPRTSRSGDVIGIAGFAQDISQRRHVERSEQREAAVFRNLYDGVIISDEKNRIIDWNPGAERLYGYTREEALGNRPSFVQRPEIADRVTAEITESITSSGQWSGEVEFLRKDGTSGITETICGPLRDRKGRDIGTFGINRDITKRKHTEDRLQAAKQAAEEANRAKSHFLANVSHEIRTPLNGILGMANLVLTRELPAEIQDPLEVIRSSAEGLREILEDVLDLSKIEAGKLILESVDFRVADVIREVVSLLGSEAERKHLELEVTLDEALERPLRGDASRFRQIVTNLVSNAVKFTHQGGVTVKGDLHAGTSPRISLDVIDTGIGVAPDMQERIFNPFTQEDASTTRRFGGTGLGLSICRRLVEMMNGCLTLESRPGEGSCFRVEIPLKSPPADSKADQGERERSPATDPTTSRKQQRARFRLLVAEDNEINQVVTAQILEHLGYRADIVANGREALEALDDRPFDLVLMDCQMPIMDGYEATQQWRAREPEGRRIPILAVTAFATPDHVDRCWAAGMDDHLGKPFEIEELATRIDAMLGIRTLDNNALDSAPVALLERLAERKGSEVVKQVVNLFSRSSARHLDAIREAIRSTDGTALEKAGHALIGSAASVGAGRVSALGREIEARGRDSNFQDLEARVEVLEQELRAAITGLEDLTEGLSR